MDNRTARRTVAALLTAIANEADDQMLDAHHSPDRVTNDSLFWQHVMDVVDELADTILATVPAEPGEPANPWTALRLADFVGTVNLAERTGLDRG